MTVRPALDPPGLATGTGTHLGAFPSASSASRARQAWVEAQAWLCIALARMAGLVGQRSPDAAFDPEAYHRWRGVELRRQLAAEFPTAELAGADVLDFGCGEGELSLFVAELGARSVVGTELSAELVAVAERRAAAARPRVPVAFVRALDETTIAVPDASIDVILCFDVLEHVMRYREIVAEWGRTLRRGGRVLVWWVPWRHPYGHHVESLVPVPWVHLIVAEAAVVRACARVYDRPDFRPRIWDQDPAGRKLPNKWRALDCLPGVNRLTMAGFESVCREAGLVIESRRIRGFGGSALTRSTRLLARLPILRELFCSHVGYVLRRA